jgi:two-component system sensor kinase FixL
MSESASRQLEMPPAPDLVRRDVVAAENAVLETLDTKILEAVPDAMIVVADNGIIVYANGESERLFGYQRDELLGQPVEMLIPVDLHERHLDHRRRFADAPRVRFMGQALNVIGARRDGTQFPADIKLRPVASATARYVLASVRDITERATKEAQLRAYTAELESLKLHIEHKNAELEQQNGELEQFAYVASHDLQEPLRKIIAFGDRLKTQYADALDETGSDYLARMQSAARRMQELINALLEFSRVTTRVRPLVRIDLKEIIDGVLLDLELAIERHGCAVDVGELAAVQGDPVQLRQLFQNVISNALKFHAPGASPRVRVHGHAVAPGGAGQPMVEVRVEDNGIGIEKQHFERIFNVFERLNGRDVYPGTGIGLAVCKKIVIHNGGCIFVESERGMGTTFVIRLPAAPRQGRMGP